MLLRVNSEHSSLRIQVLTPQNPHKNWMDTLVYLSVIPAPLLGRGRWRQENWEATGQLSSKTTMSLIPNWVKETDGCSMVASGYLPIGAWPLIPYMPM